MLRYRYLNTSCIHIKASITLYSGESWDEQLSFTMRKALATLNDGVPDWDKVARQVAQSEPPRVCDIQDHIKFIRAWGGGVHCDMLARSLEYIQNSPSTLIVSGEWMRAMATVSKMCTPEELMPFTVHATLCAHATGDKDRNGMSVTITEALVKSLGGGRKSSALEVNKILQKSSTLFGDSHAHVFGDMGVELVKVMFKLPTQFKDFKEVRGELWKPNLGPGGVQGS